MDPYLGYPGPEPDGGDAPANRGRRRQLAGASFTMYTLARPERRRRGIISFGCLGRLWGYARRRPAVEAAQPVGRRRSALDDQRTLLERLCCGPGGHVGFPRMARLRPRAAFDDGRRWTDMAD